MSDVFKEESDTMETAGITTKEFNKFAAKHIKTLYFSAIDM